MTRILAALAGFLMLLAYLLYHSQIFFSDAKPSMAAWLVFGFLVILNTTTYMKMSGDWIMSVLPILGAIANLITTVVVVLKGAELGSLNTIDRLVLLIGVLAGLVWWRFQNAGYANVIVMAALAIGFVPIYSGLYHGTVRENPYPWFVWTSSYIVGLVVILRRWKEQPEKKNRLELVYPITCGILHCSVGLITLI